jgi:hypothetical protein
MTAATSPASSQGKAGVEAWANRWGSRWAWRAVTGADGSCALAEHSGCGLSVEPDHDAKHDRVSLVLRLAIQSIAAGIPTASIARLSVSSKPARPAKWWVAAGRLGRRWWCRR